MAFVNEPVPEEQKEKFDITVFYHPKRSIDKRISFYRWVVDRERDVFLIRLGGGGQWEGGDMPKPREYLALGYKGQAVKFEALFQSEGSSKNGTLVEYIEVYNVQIPPTLKWHRGKIMALIEEALDAMGDSTGHREKLSEVKVTFNQTQRNLRKASTIRQIKGLFKINRFTETLVWVAIFCWSSYSLLYAMTYETIHQVSRFSDKSHVITYAADPGFFILYALIWALFWLLSVGFLYFRIFPFSLKRSRNEIE